MKEWARRPGSEAGTGSTAHSKRWSNEPTFHGAKQTNKRFAETCADHLENISELFSIAIALRRVKELVVEESDREVSIRPQMHVLIRANVGEFKSRMLKEIKRFVPNAITADLISAPGLVGAIDRNKNQFVPGLAWDARNNLLLLDEFSFMRRNAWVPWLKLLEEQAFGKKTGQWVVPSDEKDEDLFFKVQKGYLYMQTRFTAIIATMRRFESQHSQNFEAFLTRCVPYEYSLTLDEMSHILKGKAWLKLKKYKVKDKIRIPKDEYYAIHDYVRKNMIPTPSCKANFGRIVNDCIRIHAAQGNADEKLIDNVIWWKTEAYRKIGAWYRKEAK